MVKWSTKVLGNWWALIQSHPHYSALISLLFIVETLHIIRSSSLLEWLFQLRSCHYLISTSLLLECGVLLFCIALYSTLSNLSRRAVLHGQVSLLCTWTKSEFLIWLALPTGPYDFTFGSEVSLHNLQSVLIGQNVFDYLLTCGDTLSWLTILWLLLLSCLRHWIYF